MDKQKIQHYGDELFEALRGRKAVAPITERESDFSIEDAYHISTRLLERRVAEGERVIGKKIGVTSKAVQRMLNVHQPDFGYLTDRMLHANGDALPASTEMIAPRAEGEIAFILKRDLIGPGVTNAQVLAATECVMPCFEIVDSRIKDWKIKIEDTIADNASCGVFVLGDTALTPRQFDLVSCGMVMQKNGEVVATGAGAAALGSPVNCVTWLANTLGEFGIPLKAGEIILSGSLVPLLPVAPGDHVHVSIGGLGTASVRFA
ncbi:2-oxopent-4-enoate hydratase [Alkalilimnicola sp. S0819]|uniref:2-oxopent-4-enoate hydratase n=1 Tax=Alkalilimnicola sp. S0819 TaxID=2613922 RepID=UPI0012614397|nr:2-oxopent-4-enoate hydratase [Alkalilimnicola sp. S0819]KAB7623344.1 2-oxopent-4-enoate hydratase [Alkalilimnicola sp. S0819]MPQ16883.1 2-oxopent-4-enoate hydratase [Alkalilimnicola sp. S0819]